MFRIVTVEGSRFNVQFSDIQDSNSNTVSVITGPNGSGKTELLTVLAAYFKEFPYVSATTKVKWKRDNWEGTDQDGISNPDGPRLVITQTFSPFTRFVAPVDEAISVTDIYEGGRERQQRYRCIGLHKRSKYIGGVLSKHTLEQGLFRLSEAPSKSREMAEVLETLGFKDSVHLVYRKYPAMRELMAAFATGELHRYLLEGLNDISGKLAGSTLAREARISGPDRLASLLGSALGLLAPQLGKSAFDLTFSFSEGRASEDFAKMQALALLRRLKVLRLDQCNLTLASGKGSVDLADASSGQQQMLSSFFGLVAELRSDSLVLIDEPELSLHPTWQMSFLGRLEAILQQFRGCHVLIATHSPLIVQSALERRLEVIQLQPQAAGFGSADAIHQSSSPASVESTLLEVFHTPIRGSVYLANEIFDIVAEGEEGGEVDRQGALARLEALRQLYNNESNGRDARAQRLIEDAILLVEIYDDEVPSAE